MTTYTDQEHASVEKERLKALLGYDILDSPPDNTFDKLTKLAAQLMKVPVAIISLVDENRIWFKSAFGLNDKQMEREAGLCNTVILADDFYQIENATIDSRSFGHQLVVGDFGLKFYAAYPLKNKEGFNLGALCIIDREPRSLTTEEQELLRDLRDIVMEQIELKLASKSSIARYNQILNTTAHDLKNPLTTIPVRADLIKLKKHDPDFVDAMCDQIKIASLNMVGILDELLQSGSMEAGEVRLLLMKLNVASLVNNVVAMNQPLAEKKGQNIYFDAKMEVVIHADEGRLNEVIDNLINNAIKYAPLGTSIYVKVWSDRDYVYISIQDEGPGITLEDKKLLFQRFRRLSAQPTGGENSTGLGLSIVKVLVEAHGGSITVESDAEAKGTIFIVQLPLFRSA